MQTAGLPKGRPAFFMSYKLKRYIINIMNIYRNRGNAYIEYFILAVMVGLATLAFFNGGLKTARTNIEAGFDAATTAILAP